MDANREDLKIVDSLFKTAFTAEEHKVDKISFYLGAQYLMNRFEYLTENTSEEEMINELENIEDELNKFYETWQR